MSITSFFFAFLALCALLIMTCSSQRLIENSCSTGSAESDLFANRSLLFSDEFNTGQIDTSIWRYDTSELGNKADWGNNELQRYTDSNAYVDDDALVIVANYDPQDGKDYTSSRLHTHGTLSVHYGLIAACIKLPASSTGDVDSGTWPAFWTLGDNFNGWEHEQYGGTLAWPHSGEIDIMEANKKTYGYTRTLGTAHWGAGNGDGDRQFWGGNTPIQNPTSEYHIYAVEWTSSQMKFYLDNKLFHTHNILDPETVQEEFTRPHFLLLNLAVGGDFVATPNPANYPQKMYVDWVRVYK